MDSLNILILLVCLHVSNSHCYHIECVYQEKDNSMEISGLETIDEFNDYLNKCGHYGINVLKYDKCYVGNVNIPIKKIIKNYPKVRSIFWDCKGNCVYPASYVGIFGCNPGMFFYKFLFYNHIKIFLTSDFNSFDDQDHIYEDFGEHACGINDNIRVGIMKYTNKNIDTHNVLIHIF